MENLNAEYSIEELENQHSAELPSRDLMVALTFFGLPLVGVSDVSAHLGQRLLA